MKLLPVTPILVSHQEPVNGDPILDDLIMGDDGIQQSQELSNSSYVRISRRFAEDDSLELKILDRLEELGYGKLDEILLLISW